MGLWNNFLLLTTTIIFSFVGPLSPGYCQDHKETDNIVQFTHEPQDVHVTIGDDAFFPCTILDTSSNLLHIPTWNISSRNSFARFYHPNELPSYVNYNGSGLVVRNVSLALDKSSYSCCLGIYFGSEHRFVDACSRPGVLSIDADCGPPMTTVHGLIKPYNNTQRGSEATFHCDVGLFPPDEMTAVCTLQDSGVGMWSPDPEKLECTDFCPYFQNVLKYEVQISEVQVSSAKIAIFLNDSLNEFLVENSVDLRISLSDREFNVIRGNTSYWPWNGTYLRKFSTLTPNTAYTVSLDILSVDTDTFCLIPTNSNFTTDKAHSLAIDTVIIPMVVPSIIFIFIIIGVISALLSMQKKRKKRKWFN